MIEFTNVNKNFGKFAVLKDFSLKLENNQCIGLIGPNASGKTTLIKSILGLVIPQSGTILFQNQNIANQVSYKNHIGYMPQIGIYPKNMSILQVVEMIKNLRQFNGSLDEDLWYSFGLDKMADKKMGTLSGGTTQKVSAVLAFLFNPDVLILDEPTAGLDPLAAEILREKILLEREKGKLIMITSHLLSELDDLLSHIIFMQEGKLEFYSTLEVLFNKTGQTRISKAISSLYKKI